MRKPLRLDSGKVWLLGLSRITVPVAGTKLPDVCAKEPMRAVNEPAFNVPLVSVTVPPGTHKRSCRVYVPPEPLMVKPPKTDPLERIVPPVVVRVRVSVPEPQNVPALDQFPATL